MGSVFRVPNCGRVASFECVGRIPASNVGIELVYRGGVQPWPSAPGFRNRCPSRGSDPECVAQLHTIKSAPQFETRCRNPSARCRTVYSDQPSEGNVGTLIRRGTGTILRTSVRHIWSNACCRCGCSCAELRAAYEVCKHEARVTRSDFRVRVLSACRGFRAPDCDTGVRMRIPNAGSVFGFLIGVHNSGSEPGLRVPSPGFRVGSQLRNTTSESDQNSEHIVGNRNPKHAVGTHTGTGTPSRNPVSESRVGTRVRKSTLSGIWCRVQVPNGGPELKVLNVSIGFRAPNV